MTLPDGWTEVSVGDLGRWEGGGTPSKANREYWTGGTIPWVSPKDMKRPFIEEAEDYITQAAIANSAASLIEPSAILLVTRSGILRRTLPVAATNVPVAINQDLKALSPSDGIAAAFLRYAFVAFGPDILHECAKSGTTVDSIDFDRLKSRQIELPPTAEQLRIVAKLDALTARLARTRAELDRIPALASKLRRQALVDALEGKSISSCDVAGWAEHQRDMLAVRREAYLRDRRGSRLRSDVGTELKFLSGRRAGWLDCRLADVISLRVGYAFKSKDFSKNEGIPLVRGANIAPGHLDWTDQARLPAAVASDFGGYALAAGDIVIAMDRPVISTGLKIAQLRPEDAGSLLVQRVANPRPSEWIDREYLMVVLQSDLFMQQIEIHATGSDLPHISGNDILTTPCPLPPLDVQREIVRFVRATFARADRLEAEASRARALIDRLESAILAKAFRGELVPQDPNDEPASVLLDRIRAERAAAPKAKRGRRTRETIDA